MRYLNKEDYRNIVIGSNFYGGGGGGSMEEGMLLIEEIDKLGNPPLPLLTVGELPDDPEKVGMMVAAIGSPAASKGYTFQEEGVEVIRAMMKELEGAGKSLSYIYSGEMGAGNTILPVYAAIRTGVPFVDLDGNGRAVPEMTTSLQPLHGVATSPFLLATEEVAICLRPSDPMDSAACERIARELCNVYEHGLGFAAWNLNKAEMERGGAVGAMSACIRIGEVLSESSPENVLTNLEAAFREMGTPFRVLVARGEITKIEMTTMGGFDTGIVTIREEASGEDYVYVFQNESLYVRNPQGEVIVTVPDIISVVELGADEPEATGIHALSNSEIEEGKIVALTVTKADPRWYDLPACTECWLPILESAEYDGPVIGIREVE